MTISDQALSFMVSHAMVEPEVRITVIPNPTSFAPESKKHSSKFAGECPAPKNNLPPMRSETLPSPEGKPTKETATIFMQSFRRVSDRPSQIRCIAAFMGYNPNEDYGAQELSARSLAMRLIRPIAQSSLRNEEGKLPEYQRTAAPTVAGYVAGLPDNIAKKIAGLEARIVLALDSIKEHLKLAKEAKTPESKMFHQSLAKAEQERLGHIKEALNDLL